MQVIHHYFPYIFIYRAIIYYMHRSFVHFTRHIYSHQLGRIDVIKNYTIDPVRDQSLLCKDADSSMKSYSCLCLGLPFHLGQEIAFHLILLWDGNWPLGSVIWWHHCLERAIKSPRIITRLDDGDARIASSWCNMPSSGSGYWQYIFTRYLDRPLCLNSTHTQCIFVN